MQRQYREIAELLTNLKRGVVLTGAGISAESGIPTFRSRGGLYKEHDPTVYASIRVFRRDPSKYWSMRGDFIRNYNSYEPNEAHFALVELERMGLLSCVITQNVDGLHKKAGSRSVVEIHGSLRETYCVQCGREFIAPDIPEGTPPYCPSCGSVLKPNTVLFGEDLPPGALSKAEEEASSCKVMLLVGTSAVVTPAAELPLLAQRNQALVVEVNIERAFEKADYFIKEKAATALPEIVKHVRSETEKRGRRC
ncbi:MAG: SIR2 family NAD-dependent protein deacylase [Planctomycetota bacterium]|jgi:NAD-dependent deacetylase